MKGLFIAHYKKIILTLALGISVIFSEECPKNEWAALAQEDLKATREFIKNCHPAFVDKEASHISFHQWLEEGYVQSLELADRASSFGEYRDSLAFYIAGFRDGHLSINTHQNEPLLWPGFLISYRDGKYFINSESLIPNGAEVIMVNNKSPELLMRSNLFPYVNDDPSLESSWIRLAPFLLIDNSRAWAEKIKTVTYRFNGIEQTHKLEWTEIDQEAVARYTQLAAYGLSPQFSIHEFGDEGIWVSIPTFNIQREGVKEALLEIIDRLPGFRDKKSIVFDLRGNTGGGSHWVVEILCALYGKDYLSSVPHIKNEKALADDRLTINMIQKLKKSVEGSDDQKLIDHYQKATAAYEKGDLFMRRSTDVHFFSEIKQPGLHVVNPVSAKVYLLTDGRCFSSGLIFADTILSIPGVVHIGASTNADTQFSQAIAIQLPSQQSFLHVPTMVRRNWERGDNEPYHPKHVYQGYMGNQKQLEDWVVSLPAE